MQKDSGLNRRGIILLIIALVIFAGFTARLFFLQVVEGGKYREIAKNPLLPTGLFIM